MATSFLNLTNRLLERINEVVIAQADFASARGVQATAKTAINSSIETINLTEFEWPFNAAEYTENLVAGTEEYSFPSTLKSVRWDSFHITADTALGTGGRPLKYISRDSRNRYLKNRDDVAGAAGLNEPLYVFQKQGSGYGVSPSPDAAYEITYEYFLYPVRLSAYDDVSTIPPMFDEVIIQGGLYHMYMFRDNTEQAREAEKTFNNGISQMRSMLINNYDTMESTWINHKRPSGGVMSNDYFNY